MTTDTPLFAFPEISTDEFDFHEVFSCNDMATLDDLFPHDGSFSIEADSSQTTSAVPFALEPMYSYVDLASQPYIENPIVLTTATRHSHNPSKRVAEDAGATRRLLEHNISQAYHELQPPSTPLSSFAARGSGARAKRSTRTLRQSDWNPYKERIIQLHIKEKKSLKEVNAILIKEGLPFNANQRQYRRIITDWGLDKNVKFDEMEAIVRKRQHRRLIEVAKRKLIFQARGAPVYSPKIIRWMKRYGASPSALYVPKTHKKTPITVHCWTAPHHTLTICDEASCPTISADCSNAVTQMATIKEPVALNLSTRRDYQDSFQPSSEIPNANELYFDLRLHFAKLLITILPDLSYDILEQFTDDLRAQVSLDYTDALFFIVPALAALTCSNCDGLNSADCYWHKSQDEFRLSTRQSTRNLKDWFLVTNIAGFVLDMEVSHPLRVTFRMISTFGPFDCHVSTSLDCETQAEAHKLPQSTHIDGDLRKSASSWRHICGGAKRFTVIDA